MESYYDDSETESERYDSLDEKAVDDDEARDRQVHSAPTRALKGDVPIPSSRSAPPPPSAAALAPSTDVSLATPWNNVLALTLGTPNDNDSEPQVEPPPRPPPATSVPIDAFVSPFAVLEPTTVCQQEACPRCFARVDVDPTPAHPFDIDTPLSFCVCCKRSLPRDLLLGDLEYALRCATCVRGSVAPPGLFDVLIAELPSHVRIAADADAALMMGTAFVREYNAQRKRIFKLTILHDTRIRKASVVDTALVEAIESNMAKRRAALHSDAVNACEIFAEWVALEEQRVALVLQRLVVLDQLLGKHFLQSPPTVAAFLRSNGLTPVDPFPTLDKYDASEQCSACEVLLCPPAAVVGDEQVRVGRCDCCKRILPEYDVGRARFNSNILFCSPCHRRRGFSMISDAKLIGIPSVDWCRQLFAAVTDVGRKIIKHLKNIHLTESVAECMAEAAKELALCRKKVDGLDYRLETVVREEKMPMDVSRRWYAELSAACHGLAAAAFKVVRISTEIDGPEKDRKMWKPIIHLVETQDGHSEHAFPEWLSTFIHELWAKPQSAQDISSMTDSKRPPETASKSSQFPVIGEATNQPCAATTEPSPSIHSLSLIDPVGHDAKVSPLPPTSNAQYTCDRCAQARYVPRFGANRQTACCDCCELVLPEPFTPVPVLHPLFRCVSRASKCSRRNHLKRYRRWRSQEERMGA